METVIQVNETLPLHYSFSKILGSCSQTLFSFLPGHTARLPSQPLLKVDMFTDQVLAGVM